MEVTALTIFDRTIARRRSPWRVISICLVMILLPFLAAYLDGQLRVMISQGIWRYALVYPVVASYILLVAPLMDNIGRDVVTHLRSVTLLDDAAFNDIVRRAGSVPRLNEALSFTAGAVFGLWWTFANNELIPLSWFNLYWILSSAAFYGLLVWMIYLSLASTRITSTLHRQPMAIDTFDITHFMSVGRQGFIVALVFIGGVLLSLIFSADPQSVRYIQFWLVYIPLAVAPLLIFFLNMRPTHIVLSAEKKRRQEVLKRQVHTRLEQVEAGLANGEVPPGLSAELGALSEYEKRLQSAPTWPYDTAQLRTIFFSILIPAASMVLRLILENWLI